jgi:hypothetical protein
MPVKDGGRFQLILTKTYLTEHYVLEGKSVPDIAVQLGCSNSAVDKAIRRCGIVLRGKEHEDLTGKEFGSWKVMGFAERRSYTNAQGKIVGNGILWHCECLQCRSKAKVWGQCLRQGGSTKCQKCAWKNLGSGHGEISGQYWGYLRRGATARSLVFDLAIEDAWSLFLRQERKCVLTGWDLCFWSAWNKRKEQTASLDRIDSTKGYIPGNVQWVHKNINKMKSDFTQKDFISLCNAVARTHPKG